MRRLETEQRFTILEVAADWHGLMVPRRGMQPFTASGSGQVDPRRSTTDIPPPQSAHLGAQICDITVKGQGHWERKCKNHFSRTSSSKVDRFTSNQDKNDQRPILQHSQIHFTGGNALFGECVCNYLVGPHVHLRVELKVEMMKPESV